MALNTPARETKRETKLPTFLELAENKLSYAGSKDKIITIKVCINTARMMVEAERGKASQ